MGIRSTGHDGQTPRMALSCRASTWLRTIGAAALCVALVGCDLTGEYEKRFQDALKTSAERAEFDLNLYADPVEVVDVERKNVGVKLRIPKLFDNSAKSLGPKAPRAQPPFIALPGLSYAMERQLNDAGGQFLPTYLYFATVPKAEQKADMLQASLLQPVAGALAGAAWGDALLKTPDGKTITLRRLHAEGAQEFTNLQKNQPVKVAGTFDLYYIDAGAHHVLIGWRAPKAQGQQYRWEAITAASMGTVEVDPSAAPPAKGKGAGG
jgi:hypothetical protein